MNRVENPVTQSNDQGMLCPTCQFPLKEGFKGSGEIDYCGKCHGIWVDILEERHVLDLKPQVFTLDELKRFYKNYRPLGDIEPMRYIPCPVCRELMYRKNWGGHSGVMVSQCAAHGSWFSSREKLEKVKEYVVSGGLEYEKLQFTAGRLEFINKRLNAEILERRKETKLKYGRVRL